MLSLKIEYSEKEHKFVMFNTGTAKLSLFGTKSFYRGKLSHVKLYFPTKNIEGTLQSMKKKGVKFTSEIQRRHWGKIATFVDPENNEHYLYEER